METLPPAEDVSKYKDAQTYHRERDLGTLSPT